MNKITNLMQLLGIHGSLLGYSYLQYALELCLKDEDYMLFVWKWLYGDIAAHFGKNRSSVERALRTVVSVFWNYGNRNLLNDIAGYYLDAKPTVGEFIGILHHYLSKEYAKKTLTPAIITCHITTLDHRPHRSEFLNI